MLNAMEVREDDESFKNAVDLLFDALEQKDPDHFAVRQYKKYKLAAGLAWLAMAFLISPYGLPMAAAWLVGKLGGLNDTLRDFLFS